MAWTRLSSAGPGVRCKAWIRSGRMGLEELGTICGMRFAAGRSKNGAAGSPWVGGMIQGNSLDALTSGRRSVLEVAVVPEDKASRSVLKTTWSQYFSSSHIWTRSCSLRVVFSFFSAAAPANSSGRASDM